MSDESQITVRFDGNLRHQVTLTGLSDGTGETGSTKVDIGNLRMSGGQAGASPLVPGTLVVEKIEWDLQGYTYINLYWDTDEDNYIAHLAPGSGEISLGDVGLVDPARGQANGNINLTSVGADSGDTYTISLWLRKKA